MASGSFDHELDPTDPAVLADNRLIEDLAAGAPAPAGDRTAAGLAALRDEVRDVTDDPIFRRLADERLLDLPAAGGPAPPGAAPALAALDDRTMRYGDVVDHQLPRQDDLTEFDRDVVNTEKITPLDEVLQQPPQDPAWRPAGGLA